MKGRYGASMPEATQRLGRGCPNDPQKRRLDSRTSRLVLAAEALKGCWRGFVRRVSASDIVDLGIRRKTCAEFILRPATTLSDASGSSTRAAGDNHPNS